MHTIENSRGFRVVVEEKDQNKPGEMTPLLQESSAIGDYDDSFENPGSSYLWIGQDHHLDREQVVVLVDILFRWLEDKRLPVFTEQEDGPLPF